jgi:hypothetical protein
MYLRAMRRDETRAAQNRKQGFLTEPEQAIAGSERFDSIPLSRPSATLSPAQSGGEGRERGWFRESLHGFVTV